MTNTIKNSPEKLTAPYVHHKAEAEAGKVDESAAKAQHGSSEVDSFVDSSASKTQSSTEKTTTKDALSGLSSPAEGDQAQISSLSEDQLRALFSKLSSATKESSGRSLAAGSLAQKSTTAATQEASSAAAQSTGATQHTAASTGSSRSVTTKFPAASMDELYKKVPGPLKAQWDNIKAAAAQYGIQPQLLVAQAMQESTGGTDPKAYSNKGGMFQFTNEDTWRKYGTNKLSDRQNNSLSVKAAAKYMASRIKAHHGSLPGALKEYSGGVPDYSNDIKKWMSGHSPRGSWR